MPLKTEKSYGYGFVIRDIKSFNEVINSACVDARSVGETHILQPGLKLGTITAGGKLAHYDDGASDGTQTCTHILMRMVDMKGGDPTAAATDQSAFVMAEGVVKQSGLGGYDAAGEVDLAGKIKITNE